MKIYGNYLHNRYRGYANGGIVVEVHGVQAVDIEEETTLEHLQANYSLVSKTFKTYTFKKA